MKTLSQIPSLFLNVGKQVKDEYGHSIGRVASFAVTPNGKFDAVFIEQGDGKFLRHSTENLRIDGSDLTLLSGIKSKANMFCDQIPLIWRKDQALKELADKKKISPELYSELHSTFEQALTQLKSDARKLSEEVNGEIARCNQEAKELTYALVNLELEHEIGKIDSQCYETAFSLVQENIKRVQIEKSDLEFTKTKLTNNLLGDMPKVIIPEKTKMPEPPMSSKGLGPSTSQPDLPEPPVVVYVKEIGKSSL
jgi:hypothetical protein